MTHVSTSIWVVLDTRSHSQEKFAELEISLVDRLAESNLTMNKHGALEKWIVKRVCVVGGLSDENRIWEVLGR